MRVRTSLGFADQGVSSFTNFAGTAIAARVLRASELGHFAVVGAIFVLVTVVVRGAVSERIVLTLSARSRAISDEMHFAAGVTLLTGALAAGCLAAGAEASYGGMRLSLVVCGGLLPGLLLQDYLRFVALTIRQPARALVLDSVWLLLEIPAFGLLLHSHNHAAWAALLAWLLPGALAAPLGFWLIPVRPRLRGSVAWLRANLAISVRFAIDNVIAQNTGLLLILVLAVVSSSAQVGYFRVAQAALLPPAVLAAGVRLAMVPELVRLREANPSGFRRLVRLSALGLVVVVVVWGLVLDLAPQWVGRALFGHTWPHVQDLVLLTTVATAAGGVCMAAFSGIRACGDASGSLRTRIRVAVVNMAAGTIGGMFFGAMGATIGLAVTVPLAAAMWWVQLGRSQRRVFDSSIEAAAPPHDVALLESAV